MTSKDKILKGLNEAIEIVNSGIPVTNMAIVLISAPENKEKKYCLLKSTSDDLGELVDGLLSQLADIGKGYENTSEYLGLCSEMLISKILYEDDEDDDIIHSDCDSLLKSLNKPTVH